MNELIIKLDGLYDTNKLLNNLYHRGKRGSSFIGSQMKKKSKDKVTKAILSQFDPDTAIQWPCYLKFEWHMMNRRKDPDNVSSGARKAILDGMQQTNVYPEKEGREQNYLPNDNSKHILGFIDDFIYDKPDESYVKISPISEEKFKEMINSL